MRKAPLIIAGLIFSIIGILNLARAIWGIPIMIDKIITLEPWTGIVAFIVMSLLAIWMFSSLRRFDDRV